MKLYPSHWKRDVPESEFVEFVRNRQKKSAFLTWFWTGITILMIVFVVKVPKLFLGQIEIMPESVQMQYYGFLFGATLGFFFWMCIVQTGVSIKNWYEFKFGNRTEVLMLKYYDIAKNSELQPVDPVNDRQAASAQKLWRARGGDHF